MTTFHRNCPTCQALLEYTWKQSYEHALRTGQTCMRCRPSHWKGKRHSSDTIAKMQTVHKGASYLKGNLGRKFSSEHRDKIRQASMGNSARLGMPHTEETKRKMSRSHLLSIHPNATDAGREKARQRLQNSIRKRHGKFVPNYNPVACRLFDEINREMGWSGVHAEKGGEHQVRGWFVDYYEPTRNIVIEYDERHHTNMNAIKKDKFRQDAITAYLGCTFIRIPHNQAHQWRNLLT